VVSYSVKYYPPPPRFVSILQDIAYLLKQEDQEDLEELQQEIKFIPTRSIWEVQTALDVCQVREIRRVA